MKKIDMKNLVSVFQVSDINESLAWYSKWLGEPDVIPMGGMAEYQLAENAWLQLSCDDSGDKKPSTIVIGVADIHQTQKVLQDSGIEVGKVIDYEVVLLVDIFDLDGNQISFAQDVQF